jgi:GH24 family phage-related lysozyme (muramidase)
MSLQIPEESIVMILGFEGLDQPSKWPGESSGITIGIGYDLGFVSPEEFEQDWSPYLRRDEIERLKKVIGLSGDAASRHASDFRDITIKRADAEKVFRQRTIPLHSGRTEKALPGVDKLPPLAQGALVSLIFNRGPGMKGDTRREMRAVRDAVAQGDLQKIADQIRLMKRLWEGKDMAGLLLRRDAEAAMVESAIDRNPIVP